MSEATHICHRCGKTITYGAHAHGCSGVDENGPNAQQRLYTDGASMTNQPRPARCIWLTEEEARSHLLYPRWAAAPADPTKAVETALTTGLPKLSGVVAAVLLALGCPHTEQA